MTFVLLVYRIYSYFLTCTYLYLLFPQNLSINKRQVPAAPSNDVQSNMSKRDVIRSTDFNMLMVLGKGSFGKVLLAERKVRFG